jgi:uncharacterized protein YecE (DUF72 family)
MSGLAWHLGTMGFSYKDWEGVFYPPGLPRRDYLAYYGEYFNAVELDSSFYGTPRPEYVIRWAQMTPDDFTFCPKMPREITHELRLRNAGAETTAFLDAMRLLGDKLGPILIQFPPDFSREQIGALAAFLRQLPTDLRYAVEFRHRSWHATATGVLLQQHDVAWVSTEYVHMPQRVYVTADFLYIRWLGRHGTYDTKDHERVDKTERLQAWLEDIRSRQDEGIETVYGFFNDEYAGFAPATCQKLKRLLGLPTKPLQPPQQGRLL